MSFLISLLAFFLPTQLGYHLNNLAVTVYGFRVDYLIPTLYLSDILAFLVVFKGLSNQKKLFGTKNLLFAFFYLLFVALNIYSSSVQLMAVYKWIRITLFILLALILRNIKKVDLFKNFLKPLSYSMFIVNILGILQWFKKGSIGGLFYLLGERSFTFNGQDIAPYPYSTFSHPNSFSGFLLVYMIYLLIYRNKFKAHDFWTFFTLSFVNIVLTNSLNVYVSAAVLSIYFYFKTFKNLPLLMIDMSSRFVTHRLELIDASLKMTKKNFLLGVGLNNFVIELPKYTNKFINAWEIQPVHNIFLLVFAEVGFVGFSLFTFSLISLFAFNPYNYPLLAILLTGMSDHYWLTLEQNMLLLSFVIGLSNKLKK